MWTPLKKFRSVPFWSVPFRSVLVWTGPKSATICQICSNLVPKYKLKFRLFKNSKNGKIEWMAAAQQPLKQRTCFLGYPAVQNKFWTFVVSYAGYIWRLCKSLAVSYAAPIPDKLFLNLPIIPGLPVMIPLIFKFWRFSKRECCL